jgi:hypothetical protein
MQRTLALVVAALSVAACSGSDGHAVNPALSGAWTGTSVLAYRDYPGIAWIYPTRVTVSVDGDTAQLSGTCPDGSGSMTAQGAGDSVDWRGTMTCPPDHLDNFCSAAELIFQAATATLKPDGTLTVSGSGVWDGCGASIPVTVTFSGMK